MGGHNDHQTFYEIADVVGFFNDDLSPEAIQGMINVIRENRQQPLEDLTSQEHEMSSVTLRYKMGGLHFSEVYIFLTESGKNTLNVLFFGDVVMMLSPN